MKALILIFISVFALAQAIDWEAKYKEVCVTDKQYCGLLKNPDGTWLRPKKPVMQVLATPDIQKALKDYGAKYGVDPFAVAASIATENSLNVDNSDSNQDWLAQNMGITGIPFVREFTIGWGQINMPAAMEAEKHIAAIEGRKPDDEGKVKAALLTPEGSVKYASLILRKVQDDYKAQGFDISKQPDILATLYNLGKSEERAKKAKEEKRQPKANYFGLFVSKHADEIRKTAGLYVAPPPPPPPVVAAPKPVTPAVVAAPVVVAPPKPTVKLVKVDTVSRSLGLVSSPMFCKSTSQGQNITADTASKTFGAPVGALSKGVGYSEISRALDCNASPWKLVRTVDGHEGWVEESKLNEVKVTEMQEERKCVRSKEDIACEQKVSQYTDKLKVNSDKKSGLIYLKPVSSDKAVEAKKEVSFSNEDIVCGYVPPQYSTSSAYNGGNGGMGYPAYGASAAGGVVTSANYARTFGANDYSEVTPQVKKDFQDKLKFIDDELKRMAREMKIKPSYNTDARNPYNTVAATLEEHKKQAISCLRAFESERGYCDASGMNSQYKDLVSSFKYRKDVDLDTVSEMVNQIQDANYAGNGQNFYYNVNGYYPTDDETKATSVADVRTALANCDARIKKINTTNQSHGYIDDLISSVGKASDEKVELHKKYLLTYAKTCHGRLNLAGAAAVSQNKIECVQSPAFALHDMQLFSRDLLANTYRKDPSSIIEGLDYTSQEIVNTWMRRDLSGWVPPPPTTMPPQAAAATAAQTAVGYCPNKTAEYIEELVKENPCIKHIYVPTQFLTQRLADQEVGPKVIYRQFETDGQYAIDVGGSCQ